MFFFLIKVLQVGKVRGVCVCVCIYNETEFCMLYRLKQRSNLLFLLPVSDIKAPRHLNHIHY